MKKIIDYLKEAKHAVALTGAGVSTLSGIKDFRGPDGIYKMKDVDYNRMFDIETFYEDPSIYYRKAKDFIYGLDAKEPSIVHNTLAKLEKAGLLKAIITQNIDLLHQKAGSATVIEVHGSARIHYCLHCPGIRVPYEEVVPIVRRDEMPKCPKCGRVLKPAITFFGESLPAEAINEAIRQAQEADLMLVLGTSLTVYPAAGLPDYTLRNGGKIIIVNNQPTPLDRSAELKLEDLGASFAELEKELWPKGFC
ncbi:MAG: NAD-dependent deacetylase [Spirochaetaceae bacterium]|jgi:NAD-dependent deacetylase|nr:NAD-dependent deacetylase [Spirochaetaceae bacterium]